jgi:hypothetical protein
LSVRDGRLLSGCGGPFLGSALVFQGGGGNRAFLSVIAAQLEDDVVVKGAGVRFLVRDAEFGEPLQYFVSFDFQLSRQLVNSDLSHR